MFGCEKHKNVFLWQNSDDKTLIFVIVAFLRELRTVFFIDFSEKIN